jgi:D-3-phosphoglycerate dehydrogenase / 2-oxoglutarate reductase
MTSKKVLVTDIVDKKGLDILRKEAEVIYLPELPGSTFLGEVGQVHAILVRGVIKINREAIEKGKNLLIVAKHGVGVDNIDIPAATEKGIVVTNTPAANSESVAELTLGLMLSISRNICAADRLLRLGKLGKRENFSGVELQGKTLGVIGMGRIGTELARKCNIALDMPVVCLDPYMTGERAEKLGYKKVEKLGDLLGQSDFVCICTPLTKETTNLIGAKELALMKPTSFLMNSARGGIVDESALYNCLKQKKIAGAAFDAFVVEPPVADNPLLSLDNFVATPHLGGITKEAMIRMATTGAEEILRVFKGQRPLYPLNPEIYKSK